MSKPRVLSGVQPSGNLHIGNYLGAIKNWAANQTEFENFFCVVDHHAITVPQTRPETKPAWCQDGSHTRRTGSGCRGVEKAGPPATEGAPTMTAEELASVTLEHLRHIRARVDQIADDVTDLKLRMSGIENALLLVKREVAHGDETDIRQQITLDKLAARVERIERRLELSDPPH